MQSHFDLVARRCRRSMMNQQRHKFESPTGKWIMANRNYRPGLDPPEGRRRMANDPAKSAFHTSPSTPMAKEQAKSAFHSSPTWHNPSLTDRKYYSSDLPIARQYQSDFTPTATVASRDDDSSSLRRQEIHSKIEALNAKSRELRSITFNAQSYTASSTPYTPYRDPFLVVPSPPSSFTSSSPTSVMSSSLYKASPSPTPSHSGSLIENMLQSQKITDAAIDSRIEFLRKQSLALSKGSTVPFTIPAIKKVTFEPVNANNYHVGTDARSVVSSTRKPHFEPWNHFSSSSAASVASNSLAEVAPLTSTPSFTSAVTSATGITSVTPEKAATATSQTPFSSGEMSTARSTNYSSKSLAMKILCEKILDGYTMTRKHCPNCSTALLRRKATAKSYDGPLSFDDTINDNAQCAFCPISTIRNKISKNVYKRVIAANSFSGIEIGTGLCESCSSPTLLDSRGAAIECSVCPVLDAACIAISREQDRGGLVSESRSCIKCGCPEISRDNVLLKCAVCDTLRIKLGEVQPSNPVYHEPAMSPSINSNAPSPDPVKANLAQLQEELQAELAKAAISQKSLMTSFHSIPQAGKSTKREPDVDESHSTMMGNENSSFDFMKLQKQLRTNKSASCLAKLQDQLKAELAKTKDTQASLIHSLHDSRCSSSNMSRDELEAELSNAKQHQVTLEKIIEGANMIEKATSNDPEYAGGLTDLLANLAPGNLSYSISQQEVDATGNVKEYIPPPTFFRHSIPKEVIVYHIPEEHECDPSVAAQSHHTHNLKQTKSNPPIPQNGSMFDCCGSSPAADGKNEDNALHQDENDYDYDTIETEDDYTVDYTLNTVDNGRLEYLRTLDDSRWGYNMRSSQSRASGSIASVQNDKYQYSMGDMEKKDDQTKPSATSGRCFFMCFNCGGDDDAYSIVESSKRGITVQEDGHQQYPAGNLYSSDCYNGRDDESVHLRSPSPFSYIDSVHNESDFGSMNRMSHRPIKTQPKSSLRHPPTDHNSVQSDLTDHSNVIRRVTFGNSYKREYQELRALTEESEGDAIDKYSTESVGSAFSNHRVDMNRKY